MSGSVIAALPAHTVSYYLAFFASLLRLTIGLLEIFFDTLVADFDVIVGLVTVDVVELAANALRPTLITINAISAALINFMVPSPFETQLAERKLFLHDLSLCCRFEGFVKRLTTIVLTHDPFTIWQLSFRLPVLTQQASSQQANAGGKQEGQTNTC